jgi:hypothetical protein
VRIRHGGLSLDVPGHWRDESTLLFVGVPQTPPMVTVNAVEEPPEAVAVTLSRDAGDDPRAFLREEAARVQEGDEGFALLEEGPLEAELGTGWHQVRVMTVAGERVGQIVAAFALGPLMVCATASAREVVFDRRREGLLAVLRSLRTHAADPADKGVG